MGTECGHGTALAALNLVGDATPTDRAAGFSVIVFAISPGLPGFRQFWKENPKESEIR